jgi:hypothetical protein
MGHYKDGLKHGMGILTLSDPLQEYQGEFENGLYSGLGVLRTPAQEFRGEFEEGKMVIFCLINLERLGASD